MTNPSVTREPHNPTLGPLARGRWRVNAGQSTATFAARGVWGAVLVKGCLGGLSGTATFHPDGRMDGELTIPAGSLDSGNRLRDRHLKSRAFLDVKRHPHIRFHARSLTRSADGHVIEGTLQVGERSIDLALPIGFTAGQRVALSAHTVLDRDALGLGHNPLGMIRGQVTVTVYLVLEPN
jgi:polyisoprenoid-binding protein YceI